MVVAVAKAISFSLILGAGVSPRGTLLLFSERVETLCLRRLLESIDGWEPNEKKMPGGRAYLP
jgi:hypothetical protein